MIHRVTVVVLALILAITMVAEAGKKERTGTIEDNIYTDNLYGFTFHGFSNWKFSGPKKEDPEKPNRDRFTLAQSNYAIPNERRSNQEDYTPPTLGLWVDTTSMPIDSFAVEISNPKSKLKARKELAKSFPMLKKGNFIEQARIQIDGADGFIQQYRAEYEAQIYDRLNDNYTLIEEVLLGDLYMVRRGGLVFVFQFRAERINYRQVKEEVKKMILTLDFDPPKPEDDQSEG